MSPKRSTSAETPSTADFTDCTSPFPTTTEQPGRPEAVAHLCGGSPRSGGGPCKAPSDAGQTGEAAEAERAATALAHLAGIHPTGGLAGDASRRSRFAWAVTGSGHFLTEAMELAFRLPNVDFFLSAAAEEVLPIYEYRIDGLKERFRVFRDKTASAVPVGMLYDDVYHTVVIAPATSNTVAKCAFGISDTLPTNIFAQAGKLAIPGIVFACDVDPVVITKSPREWVELRPRNIELENVERLRRIDHCRVVESVRSLEEALDARLAELSLKWNTLSS